MGGWWEAHDKVLARRLDQPEQWQIPQTAVMTVAAAALRCGEVPIIIIAAVIVSEVKLDVVTTNTSSTRTVNIRVSIA